MLSAVRAIPSQGSVHTVLGGSVFANITALVQLSHVIGLTFSSKVEPKSTGCILLIIEFHQMSFLRHFLGLLQCNEYV